LRGNIFKSPGCESTSGFFLLLNLIVISIALSAQKDHEQDHDQEQELIN